MTTWSLHRLCRTSPRSSRRQSVSWLFCEMFCRACAGSSVNALQQQLQETEEETNALQQQLQETEEETNALQQEIQDANDALEAADVRERGYIRRCQALKVGEIQQCICCPG
jgi:uncharacterized protein YlxW (UPF0749 family)